MERFSSSKNHCIEKPKVNNFHRQKKHDILHLFFWGVGKICNTLQRTNISLKNGIFEDDFPFPKVGYVRSLEGIVQMEGILDHQLRSLEVGNSLRSLFGQI